MDDCHRRSGRPLRRPLLVIVSGAPGSGKTTTAAQLAAEMRLPHLNRDLVRDGLWMTDGDDVLLRTDRAWTVWISTVKHYLREGVSTVIDQTFYRGRSDVTVRTELVPLASAVNIHLAADNANERFRTRVAADPRLGSDLAGLMKRVEAIQPLVRDPLDFGCSRIDVDTTSPPIDIRQLARRVWALAVTSDAS